MINRKVKIDEIEEQVFIIVGFFDAVEHREIHDVFVPENTVF